MNIILFTFTEILDNMALNLQPHLENALIELKPLVESDFENLFLVASDPLIWEQHPDKLRYTRDVFAVYFASAVASKSAFMIYDKNNGNLIGSTRYYDYLPEQQSIAIGYTFLVRACWGNTYNKSLKKLMIDYAFTNVKTVVFHVGSDNMRSRKAVEKLGAVIESDIDGRVTYTLSKNSWL